MNTLGVLLVDDEADVVESLARALTARLEGLSVRGTSSSEKALEIASKGGIGVAIVDLNLDGKVESGFTLLRRLLALDSALRCIVLTGHATSEHGVRALEMGATSFLEKPPELPHLAALVKDGIAQSELRRKIVTLERSSEKLQLDRLIGSSSVMQRVRDSVAQAARTNQAVLITGETGVGKGICANLIHVLSARSKGHFVRYQPNFGSADLVRSELFGYTKGAFTGALEDRLGLLEEANGGTLFLDEVDELPPETQLSLLDVLQEKRYRRVGSSRYENSDFRLIAAFNRPVEKVLEEGKLRSDFYHRIRHLHIDLPPLRERLDDLADLAKATLSELRERESINIFEVEPGAIERFSRYGWPGNVREYQAAVEHAAYKASFAGRHTIVADDVDIQTAGADDKSKKGSFHEQVESYKLALVQDALDRNSGNQVQAAKELEIERSSLRRILARTTMR